MTVIPAPAIACGPPDPLPDGRWYRLHDLARESGLAAALRTLADELSPAAIPFGPAGHAILLADPALETNLADPARSEADRLFTVDLGGETVLALRRRDKLSSTGAGPGPASPEWAAGIGWIRLGVSRWLLRYCVGHARERKIGSETLLQQQMAQGMVADVLTGQLEAEALMDGGPLPGAAVLAEVHSRIRTADRIALSLLGASGFQAGLPSHTAWVSELLADAYQGTDPDGGPR